MNRDELAAGLAPTPLYRYAEVVGDELFIAGQVPLDADGEQVGLGDPAMQTIQCLDNLRTVVETHGFATTDVRQITIHVVGEHQNLLDAWDAMTSWWNEEVPPATLSVRVVSDMATSWLRSTPESCETRANDDA